MVTIVTGMVLNRMAGFHFGPAGFTDKEILRKHLSNSLLNRDYSIDLPHPTDSDKSTFPNIMRLNRGAQPDFMDFAHKMPMSAQSIIEAADPVSLANGMLPPTLAPLKARHLAACFWAWLCVIDGEL